MALSKLNNDSFDDTAVHGRRNLVINGAMQVAQRGTSLTGFGGSDAYATVDRWHFDVAATSAGRATIEQVTDAPNGFGNSLKLSCTTADTSIAAGERLQIQQRFEGQNLQLVGKGTSGAKPLTVSFYVKANGTFTYGLELFDGDNARQITKLFTTTTDWQRVELNFPADTTGALDNDNALSFYVLFAIHAGSTYTSGTLNSDAWAASVNGNRAAGIDSFFSSTSNTLFITGVQLEVGDKATPFEHRSFGEELTLCQRYYWKSFNHDTAPANNIANSNNLHSDGYGSWTSYDTANARTPYIYHPVAMRSGPTITLYSSERANTAGKTAIFNGSWSAVSSNTTQQNENRFAIACNESGLTANNSYLFAGGWACDSEL